MKNKTMKKIEKLKKGIELVEGLSPEMSFVLGAILQKQGEIIDILNSRLFEPTIAVPNKSPKQPEETEHIKLHKEVFCGVEDTPEEEYRYLDGDKPIKDKETIVFIEGLPERVWENTPEETERWEERLNNLKARLNGLPVVVEKEIDDIKEIVKQELSKAREEGFREGIELEQLLNAEFFEEDYQNPKRLRELKKKYNFKEDK